MAEALTVEVPTPKDNASRDLAFKYSAADDAIDDDTAAYGCIPDDAATDAGWRNEETTSDVTAKD